MTTAQDRLAALLAIWDELPQLCGDGWPAVERRLDRVVARVLADVESDLDSWLQEELQRAFHDCPAVLARLGEAIAHPPRPRPSHTRGSQATRGMKPLAGQLRERLGPRQVSRHVDVSCPERVALKTQRFSVVVRLLTEPGVAAASLALKLEEGEAVRVRLEAPDFEVLGPDSQDVMVRENADSAPIVFDLRPLRPGRHFVLLDFSQHGNPLGTVTARVECADDAPPPAPQPRPRVELRSEPAAVAPDMILLIATQTAPPALRFELRQQGGAWERRFAPVPLAGDVVAHAMQLYRDLSRLAVRDDPVAAAHGREPRKLSAEEVEDAVRTIGQSLWKDLIPAEFKRLYQECRAEWKSRSLLLHCDEPNLPWELVWPYGDDYSDDEPWCCTFRLTRWLRRDEHGRGSECAPTRLPLRSLAVIAPSDSGLLYAEQERLQLLELALNHNVDDLSPPATAAEVTRLLRTGGYNLLHAAAHGNHDRASPDAHSALWLEGGSSLSPRIVAGETEQQVRRARPGFVFNACETGQHSVGLTGTAGWASALIGAGASLFAAPLWEVTDEAAVRFVADFYERLFDGETVGEALRQARKAAKKPGDPTWLAYSAYAHPNATLGLPLWA
jgi:hypothetical protein